MFSQIDEEILKEVVKMGFDQNQVIESLRNRMQNEVCIFPLFFLCILYYDNV